MALKYVGIGGGTKLKKFLFNLLLILFLAVSVSAGNLLNSFWFAAGAAFAPSDIANMEFHYIADSISGSYNDGDTITSSPGWPDETTNYVLDNVSNTPNYQTNEVNGHNIVRFKGADSDRLRDLSTVDMVNTFTWVYVMKTPTSGAQVFLLRSSTGDQFIIKRSDNDFTLTSKTDGASETVLTITDFAPSAGAGAGDYQIIVWTVNHATGVMEVYLNSKTVSASVSGSTDADAITDCYFHIPTSTGYPDMDLAEMILYNGTVVSTGEKDSLMDYYSALYDITLI